MNEVYLVSKHTSYRNMGLMEQETLQSGFVAALDGYLDGPFLESGVVPMMQLYTPENGIPTEVVGTNVVSLSYSGKVRNALDKIFNYFPADQAVVVRVLGADLLEELTADPEFYEIIEEWVSRDRGVSVVYDGAVASPNHLIPIYTFKDKKPIRNDGGAYACDLDYRCKDYSRKDESYVSREVYLKRWNTCIGCPAMKQSGKTMQCSLCTCAMKIKAKWKSATCSDKANRKW
jgi:hypothetical protein